MNQSNMTTRCNGFVVVVVLCVIVMLAAILLAFNSKARTSLNATDIARRSEQALNCARAGLNIAIAAIADTNDICADGRFSGLLSGENTFTVADGSCSVTIVEENGKLNVNHLKDKDGKLNRAAIDRLLRLIDIINRQERGDSHVSYGLAPAIIDWVDSDDEVTCLDFVEGGNFGAESDYYSQLDPPYHCRNAPMDTIEELLLVKAVTPDVFARLRDFVTTKGDGRININSAPQLVIEALSEKMDSALAQMIVARRKLKSFTSITELKDVTGMTDDIFRSLSTVITVSAAERYYHVTSQSNVERYSCTVVATLGIDARTKNVNIVLYKEI